MNPSRSTLKNLFLALALAATETGPILAHHSFAAEYDANKPVTLRGVVTNMVWSNPHAWIYLDVKAKDGKVVNWALETGSPNALYRRGWRKTDLPAGVELVVEGYLAKDGTATVNAASITLPDGRRLFAGSSGTGAPGDTRR
jgi:hypothetical protein